MCCLDVLFRTDRGTFGVSVLLPSVITSSSTTGVSNLFHCNTSTNHFGFKKSCLSAIGHELYSIKAWRTTRNCLAYHRLATSALCTSFPLLNVKTHPLSPPTPKCCDRNHYVLVSQFLLQFFFWQRLCPLYRYPDEYVLEDLDVSVADYVQRAMKANFPAAWEEVGPSNELEDTYALSTMRTLEEAVRNIVKFLGMQPCERSDKVPEGKSSHTLLLAGVFRGGVEVLARAKLALSEGSVTMQLTVRSEDPDVSELITSTVG